MEFRRITKDNLTIASKVQNEIFPMGVTGIYSYHEYPNDAWLAWFGVLPSFRNQGYGSLIFDWTALLAKNKGYQTLRLYSDETFREVHQLYGKKGMTSEIYDNPDDKDPYEPDGLKNFIFSMSLTDEKVSYWNHKKLGLKERGMKEHKKYLSSGKI